MTAPARITSADYERATKAATAAVEKSGTPARIIFRLEAREIEIIVGESGEVIPPSPEGEWNDDDV